VEEIQYTPSPSNKTVLASSEALGPLSHFADSLGSGSGDLYYSLGLCETLWGSPWLLGSLAEGLISYGRIAYSLGEGV